MLPTATANLREKARRETRAHVLTLPALTQLVILTQIGQAIPTIKIRDVAITLLTVDMTVISDAKKIHSIDNAPYPTIQPPPK